MRACCTAKRRRLGDRPGTRALLVMLVVLLAGGAGCSERSKRKWRHRSAEDNFRLALPEDLEASDADERREAVIAICESRYVAREDAFRVLDAVAKTDPNTQIRCIAIRGLARCYDARPIGTLLTVLQAKPDSKEALPADEDVRWEALQAMVKLEARGVLDGPQREITRDVCIRLLDTDPSRRVKIVAAGALGAFQDRQVFQPLIRALRNRDFAIAERAELSLIALTGVTHDFDPDAWEQWLANAENPFENAGQTPQTTRPAGPTWWDKQKRAWRRALKLGNAD